LGRGCIGTSRLEGLTLHGSKTQFKLIDVLTYGGVRRGKWEDERDCETEGRVKGRGRGDSVRRVYIYIYWGAGDQGTGRDHGKGAGTEVRKKSL